MGKDKAYLPRPSGLPPNGDTAELEKVWTAMQRHHCTLQPVTLLVTLAHTAQEASELSHSWKLSNNEKRLGSFVAQHRHHGYSPDTPLKFYQDLLVDGTPLTSVRELLHYCGLDKTAEEVGEWTVPRLPVNGKDLKEVGFKAGPEFGRLLRTMRSRWKESYFTLSREELLETAVRTRERQETKSSN